LKVPFSNENAEKKFVKEKIGSLRNHQSEAEIIKNDFLGLTQISENS
jgi:hypothetical protein